MSSGRPLGRPHGVPRLSSAGGAELLPVILVLKEWGERHATDGDPIAVFEHSCGATLHTRVDCTSCGQEVLPGHVTVTGGTHPPVLLD